MRPPILLCLPLALAACGGSWSNRDLEFSGALPSRAELRSKLPTATTTTSPLTSTGTRRDELNVGDPSKAYADTRSAQASFNGVLDTFLGVLDTVRGLPPTSRTNDARVWGPYPDSQHPGYQFSVEVHQASATEYSWRVSSQPAVGGAAVAIVDGAFTASATARQGQGALVVHVKDFRSQLAVDASLQALDRVDLSYRTDTSPIRVHMAFTFAPGSSSTLSAEYEYLEQADRSGVMAFTLRSASPEASQLDASARWSSLGDGRSDALVTAGTFAGASVSECWDQQFRVSYYVQRWSGGEVAGQPAACVTFP
jgi:hypothetical protein